MPESLPQPEHDRLTATLFALLDDRKALNTDLNRYFATYGPQISPASPDYPGFIRMRTDLLVRNGPLLARMRSYNAGTLDALRSHIAKLVDEMKHTRENLVALGMSFSQESEAFTELGEMSETEHNALLDSLRDRVKGAAFEAGETGVEKALESAATITPEKAKHVIFRLQKAGADNPDLLDLVRAIGEAKNKKARVEAGKRLYKMLKDEKTIWKLNGMVDRGEYLAGCIEVCSWLAPSPWLKICAEGLLDTGKADLTVWLYLGPEEKQLTSYTEKQLRELKTAGNRYIELIKRRKAAVEELRVLPTRGDLLRIKD